MKGEEEEGGEGERMDKSVTGLNRWIRIIIDDYLPTEHGQVKQFSTLYSTFLLSELFILWIFSCTFFVPLLNIPPADTPQPIFAQPNGREIWVLLLEKAFAKVANQTGTN